MTAADTAAARAFLARIRDIPADHDCYPLNQALVLRAQEAGYAETYHEVDPLLAEIRAKVLRSIGYQALVETAESAWIVLTRVLPHGPSIDAETEANAEAEGERQAGLARRRARVAAERSGKSSTNPTISAPSVQANNTPPVQ